MSLDRLAAALADRYTIERELGEGGMATVFLAEDLKHHRKVAIKLLKPELAAVLGADRFVQEITTTAALQHPHILPLFDSGTADGFLYYVMPFIDGETLRDKLNRETQLGIEEAVRIASEVADALDYAHRHGVIHRDIKPENILLHDGRPMVADFGIALAVSAAAGGRMTETGLSLGTPHYMSPEQATAEKEIDARSDVYSVGSVLYEMLTGDPPHVGSSAQQIIMKIVTEDAAPVTKLRRSVPTNVAAAVAKSLEKLPADRFESAAEFARALGDAHFTTATAGAAGTGASSTRHRVLTAALAATTVLLAAALAWAVSSDRAAPPAPTLKAMLDDSLYPAGLAISPDGSMFAGVASGGLTLLVRPAAGERFVSLTDLEGINGLRFVPGEQALIVDRARSVERVQLGDGAVTTLVDSARTAGWCDDGSLVIERLRGRGGVLRVDGDGRTLSTLYSGAPILVFSAEVLPDCSGMFFHDVPPGSAQRILFLDFESGEVSTLVEDGSRPRYVRTGHLLYMATRPASALMALPFDLQRKVVTGRPVRLLDGVAAFDISNDGTLIYAEPPGGLQDEELTWVDHGGRTSGIPTQIADLEIPRLGPDGRHVALSDFNARQLVVYDLVTGQATTLLAQERGNEWVWAPDSRSLYVSNGSAVLRMPIGGAGAVDTLFKGELRPFAVTSDQRALVVVVEGGDRRGHDIAILRLDTPAPTLEPYLGATWNERQPALSPDGRWIAYVSDESGSNEVLVRSFPVPGDAIPISDGGGVEPSWSHDGSKIFYAGPDSMVEVRLSREGETLVPVSRTGLFAHDGLETSNVAFLLNNGLGRRWDVGGSDDRFLMVRSAEESFDSRVPVWVVTNFFDEIRRKAGGE